MARKPPWDGRWGPFLGLYLYISLAAGSTFPADKEALLEFKTGLQTDQVRRDFHLPVSLQIPFMNNQLSGLLLMHILQLLEWEGWS
jgi:hypothetical protein